MKMPVNGPMKMYKVKPLYDICPLINLPTCMYKVKNLYNDSMPSEKVSEDDLNLLEIEKYQLNIIQKLEDLKDKVLKMKEDFGIQNQTVGLTHITSSCSISTNNRKPWWNDECQMAKKKRQKRWDIFRRYPTTENYIAFKQAKSEARRVCRKCQREFWGVETFQDIVIKANPAYPPLSLWVFYKILSKCTSVRLVSYVHSSLVKVPEFIKNFQNISSSDSCAVSLTIVWREGNKDHEMMINPINQGVVEGEVNIVRYIARLLNFNYDTDPILSTQIDNWLELAHSSIIHGSNKERQSALKSLNSHLGKNNYLVGNSLSLADIVFWSSVVQAKLHENFPANVAKWYKSLSEDEMFAYCNNLL